MRPAIVFIDEIDAVAASAALVSVGVTTRARSRPSNQSLRDGMVSRQQTHSSRRGYKPSRMCFDSRPVRPGRFDRQVVVDSPIKRSGWQFLKVHGPGARPWPRIRSRIGFRPPHSWIYTALNSCQLAERGGDSWRARRQLTKCAMDEVNDRHEAG